MTTIKDPGVSMFRQIWYLTSRNFRTTVRDPFGVAGFLFGGIFIGVLVGWIFYKIPHTLTGVRSMQGFIYSVMAVQGYLLLLFATWKVSVDMTVYFPHFSLIQVYDRERQDKMYSPFAYVVAYRLSHLATEGTRAASAHLTDYRYCRAICILVNHVLHVGLSNGQRILLLHFLRSQSVESLG
jgi:ABC-2 type transporter